MLKIKIHWMLKESGELKQISRRIMISGGGTGGHIFPALAIAQEFFSRNQQHSILFVGAVGKMEMNSVPNSGFKIKGLWIDGLQRRLSSRNALLPLKLLVSLLQASLIISKFKPDIVIGTGGYASFPTLRVAQFLKKPTMIQEQNALVGITNKLLSKRARKIFVAFDSDNGYFPKPKTVNLGIPIRDDIVSNLTENASAAIHYGFDPKKKILLVLGGSLGAKKINHIIESQLDLIRKLDYQIIWQCGKIYFDQYAQLESAVVKVVPFVTHMSVAYSSADLIVCRAGAATIAELCCVGKPSILIPSPNVADNHQLHNARWLESAGAAILLEEKDLNKKFPQVLKRLSGDKQKQKTLSKNISALAKPHAAREIVNHIERELKW